MKRGKHRRRSTTPVFVFTPSSLEITQRAMRLFAQTFERLGDKSASSDLAKETMLQVNQKLTHMQISVGHTCLTTFDYNEKVVIATAIQLYLVQFLFPSQSLTTAQQREVRICQQITQFALANTTIIPPIWDAGEAKGTQHEPH